eukprot:7432082-Lingulodinium_polyedra.AAC.1
MHAGGSQVHRTRIQMSHWLPRLPTFPALLALRRGGQSPLVSTPIHGLLVICGVALGVNKL